MRQLSDLRELRRGSLTEQFLTVKHADGSKVRCGPYPLLTRKEAKKTVSLRIKDPTFNVVVELATDVERTMRLYETAEAVDELLVFRLL